MHSSCFSQSGEWRNKMPIFWALCFNDHRPNLLKYWKTDDIFLKFELLLFKCRNQFETISFLTLKKSTRVVYAVNIFSLLALLPENSIRPSSLRDGAIVFKNYEFWPLKKVRDDRSLRASRRRFFFNLQKFRKVWMSRSIFKT